MQNYLHRAETRGKKTSLLPRETCSDLKILFQNPPTFPFLIFDISRTISRKNLGVGMAQEVPKYGRVDVMAFLKAQESLLSILSRWSGQWQKRRGHPAAR